MAIILSSNVLSSLRNLRLGFLKSSQEGKGSRNSSGEQPGAAANNRIGFGRSASVSMAGPPGSTRIGWGDARRAETAARSDGRASLIANFRDSRRNSASVVQKGWIPKMPSSDAMRVDMGRMAELAGQGFHCSDVLLIMGLEAQGKDNPDLIRTVGALAGGVGFTGDICGALTGGACLLGLYGGRGSGQEDEDPRLRMMITELSEWFAAENTDRYGGIHCRDIVGDDPQNIVARCPRIVGGVYRKVRTILAEHGFEWQTGPRVQELPPVMRDVTQRACPVASRLSQSG